MAEPKNKPTYEDFYKKDIDWLRDEVGEDSPIFRREAALIPKYGPYSGTAGFMLDENKRLRAEGKPAEYSPRTFELLKQQNRLGQDFYRFQQAVESNRQRGGTDDPQGLTADFYDLLKRAHALSAYPEYRRTFPSASFDVFGIDKRTHAVMPDTDGYPVFRSADADVTFDRMSKEYLDQSYGTPVDMAGRALSRGGETDLRTP